MKARVALIAAAMLASAVALAHPDHGPDMDRVATLLDLNDSQKTEVRKIFDEQHQKMKAHVEQAHSSGTKPTREERAKFHEEMQQEMTTRLQAVLSPEQMKKLEALREHPRRGGHRWHDDGHSKSATPAQ
jgi:hypothetical protein